MYLSFVPIAPAYADALGRFVNEYLHPIFTESQGRDGSVRLGQVEKSQEEQSQGSDELYMSTL